MNYGNRNRTVNYTGNDVMHGHFKVVLASIAMTAAIRTALTFTIPIITGQRLMVMNTGLNLVASAFTGVLNVLFMR